MMIMTGARGTSAAMCLVRGSTTTMKAVAGRVTTTTSTVSCMSRRSMVTSSARRLAASHGALMRAGGIMTGGAVVLVGVAELYSSSSSGTTTSSSATSASWWQQPPLLASLTVSPGTKEDASEKEVVDPATTTTSNSSSNNSTAADVDGETEPTAVLATSSATGKSSSDQSLWDRFSGGSGSNSNDSDNNSNSNNDNNNSSNSASDNDDSYHYKEETCHGGPGKPVKVKLENDVLENLPLMSLEEVRKCTSSTKLLVTYQGIVYDVTHFVHDHPGGAELLKTAAGLDLDHFFGNYIVHGQSNKAAEWLAPLAVGKLTPEDALRSRDTTTAQVHVTRRARLLNRARVKIVVVASTLPLWMTLRSVIGWIGYFIPPLGRLLAWTLPVTVPGLTRGSERLIITKREKKTTDNENEIGYDDEDERQTYKVAVIGGGIAGCGAAWALTQSGFDVTLYEAREHIRGNARVFDWDFSPFRGKDEVVRSCVSVTAWPPTLYKNYTCLLEHLNVETVPMPLSWFVNSKVPGYEGVLWQSDPQVREGSLRQVFAKDFAKYEAVVNFSRAVTGLFAFRWAPWRWNDTLTMYDSHQGLGCLNPLTVVPLYSLFKLIGGSDAWWDIVFTPQYTASFLVDEMKPFPAVFGPIIEEQIPLIPLKKNTWTGPSSRSENDCKITTCVTWKEAGIGIEKVFNLLMKGVNVKENTRITQVQVLANGKKRVYDEQDSYIDVDRVVFACPANAVGNIFKQHQQVLYANTILSTPVYADDVHPSSGHMHSVMHSDDRVIPAEYREDVLKRASNYVEVTKLPDGTIGIENTYNFGVQTPGPGVYDLPLDRKPVMLISHAVGDGKPIDPTLIRGTANHARAHPLYSGWNIMAMLSMRLIQGRDGIYYCSNWTTPSNCHDMSLLSGIICAHAIGAEYPFEENVEAKKDFNRLRDLMGV